MDVKMFKYGGKGKIYNVLKYDQDHLTSSKYHIFTFSHVYMYINMYVHIIYY